MSQTLVLKIPEYLVIDAADAAPILAALSKGKLMEKKGYDWDKEITFVPTTQSPEIRLIRPEQLLPIPDPLKEMQRQYESTSTMWLNEYNKRQAAEKLSKELQVKIDAMLKASGAVNGHDT